MAEVQDLTRLFKCVCCLATFVAARVGSQCNAGKLIESASSQLKRKVDVLDLAMIKYLLPEEIVFEYQETPFDVAFGQAPKQFLAFDFNDKRAQIRKKHELPGLIHQRIARFTEALEAFTQDHELTELRSLAESCIPPDPFADPAQFRPNGQQLSLQAISDDLLEEAVSHRTVPGKEARYGDVPDSVAQDLLDQNISQIYLHQTMALDALLNQDKNIVVSTATASGKSLIFHTPVLQMLRTDPESTAMFIYPTKALAQDQLRKVAGLTGVGVCRTLDGDTPMEDRESIAANARVLFCNPDIIHTTMLPQADKWQRILGNLRYVIIDEIHYYGGIFGAHVSLTLRRLRRIARAFGSEPQFIGCSATIDNPLKHMATLTGLEESQILSVEPENDGSPSSNKYYVFLTTKFMTPDDPSSGRMHPIHEAAPIIEKLVRSGLRVIAFCRFRRDCELLLRSVYESNPDLREAVKGYRGGYSAVDRRALESEMFNGQVRGIVSTSALEVGIDIGELDAVVVVGFPHSLASFRQQVGRVGRRNRDSLVVYVADGSVMDQAYAHDISKVLDSPVPHIPIFMHQSIVRSHVRCAANELSFDGEDDPDIGLFPEFDWKDAGLETSETGQVYYQSRPSFNIRKGTENETVVIDVTNKDHPRVLETVEFHRVAFTLYEGAIYIHQGRAHLVIELDGDLKFAKVQRTTVKWTTRQRDFTDVDPQRSVANGLLDERWPFSRGQVKVTTVVFGYFKFDVNNRIIDAVDVNIPPYTALKSGSWINVHSSIIKLMAQREYHLAGSIHAVEHAILSTLPLFVDMEPGDVATECKAPEKEFSSTQTSRIRPARLVFYERQGGPQGYGVLRASFAKMEDIVRAACDTVDNCPCELGCAGCVAYGQCTEHNAVISKRGAQFILRAFLGRPFEGIPTGPEPNLPRPQVETIMPVEAIEITEVKYIKKEARGIKREHSD